MVHVAVAASVIACSAAMIKTVALAKRLAPLPRPIVLVGETGVGKRLLARFIHFHSGRAGAFVAVGGGDVLAATPPLAGDGPDALTGSHVRSQGPFERAQNGTLFLDALPLWPLVTQSAVLRAVGEGLIPRRGTERDLPLSCRLIVASQQPLDELVGDGRLLPALRWCIGEFVITVPPLRGRFGDIAALAYHFLDRAREEFGGPGPTVVEPEALARLVTYRWPGNARQLCGVVEWSWIQAAAAVADRIGIEHLPPYVVADDAGRIAIDLEGRRELSRWAFERARGSRNRAAALLGVHPNTIDNHRRAAAQ